MKHRIAWSAAVGLALLLLGAAPGCSPRHEPAPPVAVAGPNGQQVVLNVTGMASAADADTVQQALAAVPGVAGATVSLDDSTAAVSYDATRTNPQSLTQAIAAARGLNRYTATVKEQQ